MGNLGEKISDDWRSAWPKVVRLFKLFVYYWNHDPDWCAGGVLSVVVPISANVSLYSVAILLFAYMVVQKYGSSRAQLAVQGSPSVLISTANRKR